MNNKLVLFLYLRNYWCNEGFLNGYYNFFLFYPSLFSWVSWISWISWLWLCIQILSGSQKLFQWGKRGESNVEAVSEEVSKRKRHSGTLANISYPENGKQLKVKLLKDAPKIIKAINKHWQCNLRIYSELLKGNTELDNVNFLNIFYLVECFKMEEHL